jgi:hypothetical protein
MRSQRNRSPKPLPAHSWAPLLLRQRSPDRRLGQVVADRQVEEAVAVAVVVGKPIAEKSVAIQSTNRVMKTCQMRAEIMVGGLQRQSIRDP